MDPLLFITTDEFCSPAIEQWLLLNPIPSLYCLLTETDLLLEESRNPGSTLHLSR